MLDTASIFSISKVGSLRDISCNKYNGDPKGLVRSNRRNFVLLLGGMVSPLFKYSRVCYWFRYAATRSVSFQKMKSLIRKRNGGNPGRLTRVLSQKSLNVSNNSPAPKSPPRTFLLETPVQFTTVSDHDSNSNITFKFTVIIQSLLRIYRVYNPRTDTFFSSPTYCS